MNSAAHFKEKGYVVLGDFLDDALLEKMANYMVELYESGKMKADPQCPNSPAVYTPDLYYKVMLLMKPLLEEELGLELLPTYCYARYYKTGEILKRHKDRKACEISLTMTIAYDGAKVWPIGIADYQDQEHYVDLEPGEFLVYRGNDLDHWRDPFEGTTQTQVFFHYVDANGPYRDYIHDRRPEEKDAQDVPQ